MDEFYGGSHLEAFRTALREVKAGQTAKIGGAIWHAIPALSEVLSKPIMEKFIARALRS